MVHIDIKFQVKTIIGDKIKINKKYQDKLYIKTVYTI
jgi:hypothetical protein